MAKKKATKRKPVTPRNDGKDLELLVTRIEGAGFPPGFKVSTNRRIYDDERNQLAELDILIEGWLGTVPYSVLFECRNRPSDGAAPASWMRELIGRRVTMPDIATVVAVSTNGFSGGAITLAKRHNILLRTVANLTEEELRGFIPQNAPITIQRFSLRAARLILQDQTANEFQSSFGYTDKVFSQKSTGQLVSLGHVWLVVMTDRFAHLYSGSTEKVTHAITATGEMLADFKFVKDEMSYDISKIDGEAELWCERCVAPLVSAVKYGKDGEEHGTIVATWTGTGLISKMSIMLTKLPDEGEEH